MENIDQQETKMEAVVLAGGMGTRLRAVIQDIPKPMAPVGGKPFLSYILDELLAQGVRRAVLSTGYMHEVVKAHYQDNYKELELSYSIEDSPLGTGGAIKKALQLINTPHAIVLNGDTLFKANLREMKRFHLESRADISLALKKMEDSSRYGVVETNDGQVVRFREKTNGKAGAINGGIYMLKTDLLNRKELPEKFSFEKDFMEAYYQDLRMMAYESDAYFIDIGIPEDYEKAQHELLVVK